MIDVLPTPPTVRELLEEAWEAIAPIETWTQGEEYESYKLQGQKVNKACIIGAISVALLGGYGVIDGQSYKDFWGHLNNERGQNKYKDYCEKLPYLATIALSEAIKQEFPAIYDKYTKDQRAEHNITLKAVPGGTAMDLHKESCPWCHGAIDHVGLVVTFNDREPCDIIPDPELRALKEKYNYDGTDTTREIDYDGYHTAVESYRKNVHSEVVAIFQRAIKNEINREEALQA